MKVICDRTGLLEALNLVNPVAVTRTPKEVLRCVKLTAADEMLTVATTDLELAVRVSLPRVEVSQSGEALVWADKIGQIVRESTDPTLAIEVEQDVVHVRGQDAHFEIFGHAPDDFPPLPEATGNVDFEVEASELHRLVTQTLFATARETSRYAINGVLFEREGNKLCVVATDGRRLAMARGSCQATDTDNRSVILPSKALNVLLKIFDRPDEKIQVRLADNRILFSTDDRLLASNLVEGNFPPYKDVIPRDGDKKATLDTASLTSAVRRAALLTNEESKGVRFAFSEKGLTLSSRAPEMGQAEISLALPHYAGDPLEIGFNPQFVLDSLKIVQSDQIHMEFKASNKPGTLRTGPEFLYVIMPVSLT